MGNGDSGPVSGPATGLRGSFGRILLVFLLLAMVLVVGEVKRFVVIDKLRGDV